MKTKINQSVCALLLWGNVAVTAQAQSSDPGAVQRGVQDGLSALRNPVLPLAKPAQASAPLLQTEEDISLLLGVRVQTSVQLPMLAQRIEAYWQPYLKQAVLGVQINEFKAWLWDQLQRQGYLGNITVKPETKNGGTVLVIYLQIPTIGRTTLLKLETHEHSDAVVNLVAERFAKAYPQGALVDVQGIEAQLNAIAYDLPVNLEASLRQVSGDKIDVVINLRRVDASPGKLTSAVVQINNYGLKSYGREQLLGVVRAAGPSPLSELMGVAQVSKGVGYLRGEYSQPIAGWATRWNVYGTMVRSKADVVGTTPGQQRGESQGLGGGLTTLLNTNRAGTWHSVAELSHRQSESEFITRNTGIATTTRERRDNQLRLGLRSSHKLSDADRLTSETTLTLGHLKLKSKDASFGQPDAINEQGSYQRLEHNGALQKALPSAERWTFTTRWRAQIASQNMDSYNKMSLGGVNGIRAFDSDEGVGEEGVQVSFDLSRQINANFYAGVFYDAGRVRTSKKPSSSSYSLQGAGVSMGGKLHPQVDWSLTVAKSHGSKPAQGITGQIGDWRAFFAANWRH